MSWRVVIISSRSKLDLQLNYLVVRQAEVKKKVFIEEIAVLIIESTAVSLTAALLNELIKNKVKIVFCDEKRNPSSELIPYYGSYNTSDRIYEQVGWTKEIKELVWTEVVKDKIAKQANVLKKHKKEEFSLLIDYLSQIELNDRSNREGHAAKVYFNALFGQGFSRGQDNGINASLNYGYSILLSVFNREIVINGYLTQIGIFHKGKTNPFNFASDLMEPWRPLIDDYVFANMPEKLTSEVKYDLVNIMSDRVDINGKNYVVMDAIKIYCKSIFDALNENNIKRIRIYDHGD